jgi:membrane protease YdiL (CAAX protease family)
LTRPSGSRFDRLLAAALPLAYAGFAWTFLGPRGRFWDRMSVNALVLGSVALVGERDVRRVRFDASAVSIGLASATVLYGVFVVGDRLARRLIPGAAAQIESIYALREQRPRSEIALRLAFLIGPAEELFWRGFVQRRLARSLGPARGALAAVGAYGGAHLVTRNVSLIGAAATAGALWSALAAAGVPLGALILSHVAWDLWIFLVAPTEPVPVRARTRTSDVAEAPIEGIARG